MCDLNHMFGTKRRTFTSRHDNHGGVGDVTVSSFHESHTSVTRLNSTETLRWFTARAVDLLAA